MSCSTCGSAGPFSKNQKRQGVNRRCVSCISQNAYEQHARTHQERNFPCPGCGKLYRGMTDGALHFESGACTACKGADNARKVAYDFLSNQKGSHHFLTAPLMLTNCAGSTSGGYTTENPNYRCPTCNKTFMMLSGLMQHLSNKPQCAKSGMQPNVRLGLPAPPTSPEPPRKHRFFHGTSWSNACAIERNGFIASQVGCLGAGVYVAREDKARRFAQKGAQESGFEYGGLVELIVTVRNTKYVLSNDSTWQTEGYDSCRAERTSASTNMEWCIGDPGCIKVIGVTTVYV